MISPYAKYHAECWATNRTTTEIKDEIARCEAMFSSKIANPFPGNAYLTHSRIETLKTMLTTI